MVEVLGGRAREPTGPRRAPRTYPGPVQLQVRRVGPREDVKVTPAVARHREDSKDRGVLSVSEASSGEGQARVELIARHAQGAKSEELPSEKIDPTGRQDETEEEDVGPSGRPFAARFEHRSEPGPGSRVRREAGERNVAERRHGHPCGQQPMDEADGHRPQGAEAPRLGVHRRRCRRFWGAGFSDHRQQRSDAQSVSVIDPYKPPRRCSFYLASI